MNGPVFVTGAAGFIGSNLCDALLANGQAVVGWDNFSTGRREFLRSGLQQSNFRLITGDNLDTAALTQAMSGCDSVFHLAANADVRFGLHHPSKDFEQNNRATFNVLEAMRINRIRNLAFASTGSVYGEALVVPTPETAPFPVQTSLYGASKLAAEGMIQAYCEGFGFRASIFRFVSILGRRYTHGHVFDFYKQLREHPHVLNVLGDGTQRKSYLDVADCIGAMLHVADMRSAETSRNGVAIFNLGTDEYCSVMDSIGWISERLGLRPQVVLSGGNKGWVGDNPFIYLDTTKIRQTGWSPKYTIRQGIERTVEWLAGNLWVFEPTSKALQAAY